jgi:ankyrin repeat protein
MKHLSNPYLLSKLILATFVLLFYCQTIQIQIAAASYTDPGRMVEQSQGRIKAVKIRPYVRPKIEKTEDVPLLNAVRRNDLPIIQNLIDDGAELNIVNNQQFTPLNLAVFLGHDEAAKMLILAGADVNLPDKPMKVAYQPQRQYVNPYKGSTARSGSKSTNRIKSISLDPISPLSYAIDQSNESLALLLIENGAIFNAIESKGKGPEYPLQKCLAKGMYNAADRILAKTNGDPRQAIIDSLLIWAVRWADDKNKMPIMNFLIERNARFEIFDMQGTTPLVAAVIDGDLEIVTLLLDKGAQVDTPVKAFGKYRDAGSTPLFFAMMKHASDSRNAENDTKIIRLLLSQGADTNRRNQNKTSAVHYLPVRADGLELIQLFHEHGADLNEQMQFGETLLKKALDYKSLEVAEYLIAKGADINADRISMNDYMRSNEIATIDFLLANNFDLNKQKTDMFSRKVPLPLIYACGKGQVDYVEKIIVHGADVNLESAQGLTPLFSAIKSGNLEIIKILLDNGAEINYQKRDGFNAYVLARISGRKDIADYLKSKGADTTDWMSYSSTLATLKQAKLIPEGAEGVTRKQVEYFKLMLQKELGFSTLDDLNSPDPRFSSPEKTWALYKNALINNELEIAAQCHLSKDDHHIRMYKKIGMEKTTEVARNFRPIKRIVGDEHRSKYRIKKNINNQDIAFYIYFTNVFGEWKIENY